MPINVSLPKIIPLAENSLACLDGGSKPAFHFMINGRRFVAMDGRYLDATRSKDWQADDGSDAHGAFVGHIAADDIHYDVFSIETEPRGDLAAVADYLTRRELQIAMLIADGKCDKEIARQLGISSYTVREHLRRIFAKLKVGKRSAVVSWMLRQPIQNLTRN
ncbi:MAG: LuxR C-terminal-related transcriptional regulator [Pseudomonadota bacterium]